MGLAAGTTVIDEHNPEIAWDEPQEGRSVFFDRLVEQILPTDQRLSKIELISKTDHYENITYLAHRSFRKLVNRAVTADLIPKWAQRYRRQNTAYIQRIKLILCIDNLIGILFVLI
jgi:hypothetical protein